MERQHFDVPAQDMPHRLQHLVIGDAADCSPVLSHNQVRLQSAQPVQIQLVDAQPSLDHSYFTIKRMPLSWLTARWRRETRQRCHPWWVITSVRNTHETCLHPERTEDFRAAWEEGHNALRYGHTFLLAPVTPVQRAMRLGRKFATMPSATAGKLPQIP